MYFNIQFSRLFRDIVAHLLKARSMEPEKQPLVGNDLTQQYS
jgi:hypothetical protein